MNALLEPRDAVVIGGGFYGCTIALELRKHLRNVLLVEEEADLLRHASYANQARVHSGYHYPRSILTALRSRSNFPRFVEDYADCIDQDFTKVYAVARLGSKVSVTQFRQFSRRIGASLAPAPRDIQTLFNRDLIEEVFTVNECAFDAVRLREKLWKALVSLGIEVVLETRVTCVRASDSGGAFPTEVRYRSADGDGTVAARYVFNCTYSRMNQVLAASGLPLIPVKLELTEIALIETPPHLRQLGITVMDGPFFSTMPFPARGLHSLTHVRYTPHHAWREDAETPPAEIDRYRATVPRSNFIHMIKDAQRYVPSLGDSCYVESLWEVKTLLPQSETDDSRPVVFSCAHPSSGVFSVIGGKIDNIYDVLEHVRHVFEGDGRAS